MKFLTKKRKMKTLIENNHFGDPFVGFGVDIPIAPQEMFVTGVYSSVDAETSRVLDQIRSEDGVVPTCGLGCFCCCRFHILMSSAEAHALAQFIRREWPENQINALRLRTEKWHAWEDFRRGKHPSGGSDEQPEFATYDHCCPLLINGACGAYPVRPVVCRTHFVSSPAEHCCAANKPDSKEEIPVVLTSVVAASRPASKAIRARIENAGADYLRSMMLLPHWLAAEMGWDFDSEPLAATMPLKTGTVP